MRRIRAYRPSPAMAVALVALFVSLGGVSYGVATGSIDSREIKNNTVRTKDLRNNDVRGKDIRNSTVRSADIGANQVKGVDVLESSLGTVPSANSANSALRANSAATVDKLKTVGSYKKVSSSASNADEATARAAATEVPLVSGMGPLSVYGKCFVDTDAGAGGTPRVFVEMYVRTTQSGAIMEGDDDLPGAPFLDTGTAEDARQLDTGSADQNDASFDETEYALAAPDGTGVNGQTAIGVKNGTLAGGDGIYGGGNVCLYSMSAIL